MSFIMRMKFWIGLGLLVLAAVVLFALLAAPELSANKRTFAELDQRRQKIEQYAASQYIKNTAWIEQARRVRADYEKQLEEIKSYLAARDELLEKRFEDPEDPDAQTPLQAGRWKMVYKEKMDKLLEKLDEHVTELGAGMPLVEANLGDVWPSDAEMHREEKRYWLQKAIVDTIVNLNAARQVVPVFYEIRLTDRPERLLSEAHGEKFRCIPFQFRVAMEFKNVPRLLNELLAHKIGLELTGLSITRGEGERGGVTPGFAAPPVGGGRELTPRRERREAPRGPVEMGPGMPGYMGPGAAGGFMGPAGMEQPGSRGRTFMGLPYEMPTMGRRGALEEGAKRLPKTLVTVTIRGYLPDYLQPGEEEVEEEAGAFEAPAWGVPGAGVPYRR